MKKLVIALFSGVFLLQASAQNTDSSAYTMSLKQAVDYALKNAVSVQNADIDKQIAEAKRKEVLALGLPQINASFDVKDFLEIPTSLIPAEFFGGKPGTFIGVKFGTQYNATAGVDASQLVFDGTFFLAVKAMKSFLEIADKASVRTRIEVTSAVTKAYYNVLISEDRMKLMDANLDRLKKLQSDTKALYDNGFVEKIDLDRITVNLNNVSTERDKLQRFSDLSYNFLKYQMGMDQKAKLTLSGTLSDINFSPDATASDKFDPTSRIEFSILQTQQRMNHLDLKKNRFGYLPNLVLYASGSESALRTQFDIFDPGKTWYPMSLVGMKLTLPIFDGGQKHYRVQQSKLNIMKTENDMKALQQGLDLEYVNAKTGLINASNTLGIQKKNIDLATEIYNVAKKKYEQGIGSNLEVMTAETSLKESQTNYYSALYDALNAKVDFDKANGSLYK
ncbi:MAG TPA: TolC family protein [Bacteroidia bacterium]|jgi:outer membrane protein TolC|nr:TolC family protein [Bacteroidia bacterium]